MLRGIWEYRGAVLTARAAGEGMCQHLNQCKLTLSALARRSQCAGLARTHANTKRMFFFFFFFFAFAAADRHWTAMASDASARHHRARMSSVELGIALAFRQLATTGTELTGIHSLSNCALSVAERCCRQATGHHGHHFTGHPAGAAPGATGSAGVPPPGADGGHATPAG